MSKERQIPSDDRDVLDRLFEDELERYVDPEEGKDVKPRLVAVSGDMGCVMER